MICLYRRASFAAVGLYVVYENIVLVNVSIDPDTIRNYGGLVGTRTSTARV